MLLHESRPWFGFLLLRDFSEDLVEALRHRVPAVTLAGRVLVSGQRPLLQQPGVVVETFEGRGDGSRVDQLNRGQRSGGDQLQRW